MHRVLRRRMASAEAAGRDVAPKDRGRAMNPDLGCRSDGSGTVIGRNIPAERWFGRSPVHESGWV